MTDFTLPPEFDRRVTPARADIAARAMEPVIASERYADPVPMQVSSPVAPIFRSPSVSAPRETELLLGELFDAYEITDDWVWGQHRGDNYVGYVERCHLDQQDRARDSQVCVLRTLIFSEPDIKSRPFYFLSLGALLGVSETIGRFAVIDGGGFAITDHIAPVGRPIADLVRTAYLFLHTPYLWGGRSSLGLDCSALVQLAAAQAGIALPRDTDMQETAIGNGVPGISVGQSLTEAQEIGLERGDLVFWRGHVAIMVDDRSIIHANGTYMKVTVDPLAEFAARVETETGPVTSVKRILP